MRGTVSDPPQGEAPLLFENVTKRFRSGRESVTALSGVTFTLRPGRITGLVGADGSGKTTTQRLAAALLVPEEGRVEVLGTDTRTREPGEGSWGGEGGVRYMPQRFGLYEDLTVGENLELHAALAGLAPAARPGRYRELARLTGLAPFMDRLAGRLSGGMKQKLGLACALLVPPRVLVLDEPTVGVDPVSRRELWSIVRELVETRGTTVLLSTTYLDEAERCAEVLVLHEGRLLEVVPPAAFARRVEGRVVRVPAAGGERRRLASRLAGLPEVLDTTVQGDGVRIVLAPGTTPATLARKAGLGEETVAEIRPRFEDALLDRLREEGPAQGGEVEPGIPGAGAGSPSGRPGPEGRPVIEVEKVVRRFGDFVAVKGVSFHVRAGEVFGLLGANGAGKSTLFRMLCGLLPVSSGAARVAGVDLRSSPAAARARIGYMAQRFSLYQDLSVEQNLGFFAAAYGLGARRGRERVRWALEAFGLAPHRATAARTLPLGFRQRLALAAALMHEPEVLFLDEPTSGVDPLARRRFWRWINALSAAGVTVLVTTHFMEEAEYCDRMVIMAEGEVLVEGTPEEVRARARTARCPEPTMEDAFVHIVEQRAAAGEAAA